MKKSRGEGVKGKLGTSCFDCDRLQQPIASPKGVPSAYTYDTKLSVFSLNLTPAILRVSANSILGSHYLMISRYRNALLLLIVTPYFSCPKTNRRLTSTTYGTGFSLTHKDRSPILMAIRMEFYHRQLGFREPSGFPN